MDMDDEVKTLIAPHKEAIFFYKAVGTWPGGDTNDIFNAARKLGMAENEINTGCSGCFGNALSLIFEHMDKAEFNEYKQRKGL